MKNIVEKTYGNFSVIRRSDRSWGVIGIGGEEIVPFGKYDWIDGFDHGLARVRTKGATLQRGVLEHFGVKDVVYAKWGIINEEGEEVLPLEYDEIWNFKGKSYNSIHVVKDGNSENIPFSTLNPDLEDLSNRGFSPCYYGDEDFCESPHYGEYEGSYAQDIAGFSDDDIGDAFDGEPDAYWNID